MITDLFAIIILSVFGIPAYVIGFFMRLFARAFSAGMDAFDRFLES